MGGGGPFIFLIYAALRFTQSRGLLNLNLNLDLVLIQNSTYLLNDLSSVINTKKEAESKPDSASFLVQPSRASQI